MVAFNIVVPTIDNFNSIRCIIAYEWPDWMLIYVSNDYKLYNICDDKTLNHPKYPFNMNICIFVCVSIIATESQCGFGLLNSEYVCPYMCIRVFDSARMLCSYILANINTHKRFELCSIYGMMQEAQSHNLQQWVTFVENSTWHIE